MREERSVSHTFRDLDDIEIEEVTGGTSTSSASGPITWPPPGYTYSNPFSSGMANDPLQSPDFFLSSSYGGDSDSSTYYDYTAVNVDNSDSGDIGGGDTHGIPIETGAFAGQYTNGTGLGFYYNGLNGTISHLGIGSDGNAYEVVDATGASAAAGINFTNELNGLAAVGFDHDNAIGLAFGEANVGHVTNLSNAGNVYQFGGSVGLAGGVWVSTNDSGYDFGTFAGAGTPGLIASAAYASDTNEFATGSSVSLGYIAGYGHSPTSGAIMATTPGAAYTYGTSIPAGLANWATTMSNGFYNMAGRPYDPPSGQQQQ